jgi:uncharacterized membrane protein
MITDSSIEIDAPAAAVWEVFSDVERWPTWTASVVEVVALDGPGLAVGKRFAIEQPRLPKLVWQVTDVDPGLSWTWRARSPGATTLATHELVPEHPGRTRVRQRIEQHGPLGVIAGRLTRRMTRRYLTLEAEGLKSVTERRLRGATTA